MNIYFETLDGDVLGIYKKARESFSAMRVLKWISRDTKERAYPGGCNKTTVIDGTDGQDPSSCCHFYNDKIAKYEYLNDPGLRAVVGRSNEGETFVIVGRTSRQKGKLIAFIDAPHKPELPDRFIKVDWVCTWEGLESIYRREIHFDNILEDDSKFKKTVWIARAHGNAPIYEGLRGVYHGHYFYRDQLHGNHYEVYDGQHNHVGEMGSDGRIDWSKRAPGRRWPVRT